MSEWQQTLREQTRNGAVLLGYLAVAVAVFSIMSSVWFLWRMELLRDSRVSVWMMLTAWFHYVRQPQWDELLPLAEGFFVGLVLPGGYARYHWQRLGGLMGIGRRALGIDKLRRGSTLIHGDADWATIPEMTKVFPSEVKYPLGGIAIGELDQVFRTVLADVEFNPEDPATWGNGGRAPLMLSDLTKGSAHGAMLIPSGVGKSAVLTAQNLTWRGPRIIVDPDGEVGPQVREALEAMGLKVIELKIGGGAGFNMFNTIDLNSERAQQKIRTVVGRLTRPTSASNQEDKNAIFRAWAKSIIACLLADLMWDPDVAPELKTPATLRETIILPADALRNLLVEIHSNSPSKMARNIAGTIMSQHPETFTSAYGYATEDTVWLETEAYAKMVGGNDFDPREIRNGNLAIFLQLPLDAMRETPQVVKCVIGSLTDAIIASEGLMAAPVWMPIDEAELMDADPSIRTIINQGRKYMAAIHLFYQSESQARRVWGKEGWDEIVESLEWRQYAGITSEATAESVSKRLGTFGAVQVSESSNRGRTGQLFTLPSLSSGNQQSSQEVQRNLANAYELYGMRKDERITLTKGRSKALRHGAAMAFRRPEMQRQLELNKFRNKAAFVPFDPKASAEAAE